MLSIFIFFIHLNILFSIYYVMDSLKFSFFLFKKVSETINYRQYVSEVKIGYEYDEGYGNEYIKVNYKVTVNGSFDELSPDIQRTMFNGTPHYIFSLSTHAQLGRISERRKLLRMVEFKRIYESLASYVTLQFENALGPDVSIKIKGIDFWPEGNYAEKHLENVSYIGYKRDASYSFEYDVSQWGRLHELANGCKKIYTENKIYFKVSDLEISELFDLGVNDIRFLVLRYEIPIKVKGIKIIDKVYIHALKLVEALKKEIGGDTFHRKNGLYLKLIKYLYDKHLDSEKSKIIDIQKAEFVKRFIIQKGDILQLKDGRIVMANSIEIDSHNKIIIEYLILKMNLELSERRRKIPFDNVVYVLNGDDFKEYKDYTPSKRLSLLKKWMSKKKKKFDFIAFEPDLTVEEIA